MFAVLLFVWSGCLGQLPPVAPPPAPEAKAPEPPAPLRRPVLHEIAAEPQRSGDPAAGYRKLVDGKYVTCGIPQTAFSQVFPQPPKAERLPGRTGKSAALRYDQTLFTTASGVDVVVPNCLQCHAAKLYGELVIGLGNASADFTTDTASVVRLGALLLSDRKETAELERFASHLEAVAPYTKMATVGTNPADNLASVLFAHRDPKTFAWSQQPLLPLPASEVVPVDVPAWWLLRKKNALFHVAAGRGNHARTMMAASSLCTDDVAEAREIDAEMPDIRAYLLSLTPPRYPGPIDTALAARGAERFETSCARCHGSYGAAEHYPNVWIATEDIGTDAALAQGASKFGERFVSWFGRSFYGEISRLEPVSGYIAPPLDGIWATAPYFHNGSVPTLAGVLDSSARPTFFIRSFRSDDYDDRAVGWRFVPLDHGQDSEPDPTLRAAIYDTTKFGYSNRGHLFSDTLGDEDQAALLEYLKTL